MMRPKALRRLILACLAVLAFAGTAKADGRTPFSPVIPQAKGHCVADPAFMRRNHMFLLFHQRDKVVHEGIRTPRYNLTDCLECHQVKGADGQPVSIESPKHFCRVCHDYAAVKIDCFECHNSKPEPEAVKASAAAAPVKATDAAGSAQTQQLIQQLADHAAQGNQRP